MRRILLLAAAAILAALPAFATVFVSPVKPNADQAVTFSLTVPSGMLVAGSVVWSFGDGTTASGPAVVQKIYRSAGNYAVSVRYMVVLPKQANPIPAAENVTVNVSQRRITYVPPQPAVGFPVTFTAAGFKTAQFLWSFGDDRKPVVGTATIAHTFARTGKYVVQAGDLNGAAGETASVPVTVTEPTGMRSAFQISVLQLRFEDGLSYKVVPQRFAPLTAYVDIKYEGTGLFQAQWLVDGMPFCAVSRALPLALSTTLDTGRIPGLPTQLTGMHELSLRILTPDVGFKIPVIRYFVAADTGLPPLRGLELNLETAQGLQWFDCTLAMGELRAAAGRYFILRGKIRSGLPGTLKFGLLRIHLGVDLIDQQIVRGLAPREARDFSTSVRNPSPEARILYITLYDITDAGAPRLLTLKKITVRSGP